MKNKRKDRLDILYEDKDIIVINKPSHLLTIGTKDEKINTLYHKVHEYLYKKNKNNKVFIVHRLDFDTSGVILFAKSNQIKELYQSRWNEIAEVREYIAAVEGNVKKDKDIIKEYLLETKTLHTYSTKDTKRGSLAITEYEVLKRNNINTIVKVNIKTGKKNQIRVAMQDIGHPIVGDKKYGAKSNPIRRVCLHASKLVIKNPKNNQVMEFNAKLPDNFKVFEI